MWRRRSGTRPQISRRATGGAAVGAAAGGAVTGEAGGGGGGAEPLVSLPTRTSTVPLMPAGAVAVMCPLLSMVNEAATSPKVTVVAWPSRVPSMPATAVPGRPSAGAMPVTSGAAGAAIVEPAALLSVGSRSLTVPAR